MISSVGGRNAPPFLGAYSASKFGVEGQSESLRRELIMFGVEVIVVSPGVVATPIWVKGEGAAADFAGTPYAPAIERLVRYTRSVSHKGLRPERDRGGGEDSAVGPKAEDAHTVTPEPIQNALANLLPKRFVDRMIARRLGLIA
jgi:NAD(P)-dependent dehydrogenase (short-subunit alcohol dehydrogenase family)